MTPEESEDHMFNHGYHDSNRLVLQHWLWLYRLKYMMHPSTSAKAEHLKIEGVDTVMRCGYREGPHLPASTQIDGFDISAEHYPAKEWALPDVSIYLFDALGKVPKDQVGRYKMVHHCTFAVTREKLRPQRFVQNHDRDAE